MQPDRAEIEPVLAAVAGFAQSYLAGLDARPVRSPALERQLSEFAEPLPEEGVGACAALARLLERAGDTALATGGPRTYHLVMGGATPAALGADLLAPVLDQAA